MIDRRLRDRYSRQTMFRGIGDEGQVKLVNSSVTVIGCGALGCNIATLLVRAGVGKIRIIDRDFIEYHNLQRQTLFNEDDVKAQLPKAIAAERYLSKVNSNVEIEGIVADVNYSNIERFCQNVDVILDGLDNFETRFLINDVALKYKIPWIYGGAIASTGMTMTVVPGKTPCFRCISPILPDPETTHTCQTDGIVGTVPAIIGSLQATEAMKIIVGAKINPGIIMVDVWQATFKHIELRPRENCPTCLGRYEFLERVFDVKTTVLCGQSRAIQVVNTRVGEIELDKLASKVANARDMNQNEFMVRFTIDKYEITAFPDGRAIIKNTIDESLAKEMYRKYIGDLI